MTRVALALLVIVGVGLMKRRRHPVVVDEMAQPWTWTAPDGTVYRLTFDPAWGNSATIRYVPGTSYN